MEILFLFFFHFDEVGSRTTDDNKVDSTATEDDEVDSSATDEHFQFR